MIRHLLKLIWNRKQANLLVMVEICMSFLILSGLMLVILQAWENYRLPLGFEYRGVWVVTIETGTPRYAGTKESAGAKRIMIRDLVRATQQHPEVAAAAGAWVLPYSGSNWILLKGTTGMPVTDSFNEVMGLAVTAGRWFREDDDQAEWTPIVITERFARARYGAGAAVGQRILPPESETEMRIVGVVSEFRKQGEYDAPENAIFTRISLEKDGEHMPEHLLVKVRPGTTAAFEERLLRSLQGIAPDWNFKIEAMEAQREEYLRTSAAPWLGGALVVGFLLLMVGFGLNGVLWQSVTRRTKEIGLRRAHGATAGAIYRQVLAEILLMASLSVLAGLIIVLQLPLEAGQSVVVGGEELLGFLSPSVYATGMALSALIICLLTTMSALYPSWLAARVQPAEALHWE